MAIATWALAQTGPLDNTKISSPPGGRPYWRKKELADLPGLLLSRQVPEGDDYAGSFYWLFGNYPQVPVDSGFSEDTAFGILGLVAASQVDSSIDYDSAILAARAVLPIGVYPGGAVYEHIWLGGEQYHLFAGELLEALGDLSIAGDSNDDGNVTSLDLYRLYCQWLNTGCDEPQWCAGADLNCSGKVDLYDHAIINLHWYTGWQ